MITAYLAGKSIVEVIFFNKPNNNDKVFVRPMIKFDADMRYNFNE